MAVSARVRALRPPQRVWAMLLLALCAVLCLRCDGGGTNTPPGEDTSNADTHIDLATDGVTDGDDADGAQLDGDTDVDAADADARDTADVPALTDNADAIDPGDSDASDVVVPPARAPWIRDDQGRVLVLRGVNIAGESKTAPDFLPPTEITDFERLADDLGYNAIRLVIFWEAVEPTQGTYDDAYLAAVRALVDEAALHGVHVLVDMHQDVYGRGFGHAGFPRWTCDQALYASFTPPEDWFAGYFEPEVGECFDRFWAGEALRASYADMWAHTAAALSGSPGLYGYDLINEPFWGTEQPIVFEDELLPDFYEQLIDAIRGADAASPVGFEPSPITNLGLDTLLRPPDRPNTVYLPHFYPPTIELGTGYDGDAGALRSGVRSLAVDAKVFGTPMIIGEFGTRRDVAGAEQFLEDFYAALDDNMANGMLWDGGRSDPGYGIWMPDGTPGMQGIVSARPYPERVAGEPLSWSWDPDAGVFRASWVEDGSAAGDTVVVLPRLTFPDGADVELDGEAAEPAVGITRLTVEQTGAERELVVRRR